MNYRLFFLLAVLFASQTTQATIKFGTYNIRNFDYDQRSHTPTNKKHLVNIIDELKTDLLAVQEINNSRVFNSMIDHNFFGAYESKLTNCGGAHDQHLGFVYNTSTLKLLDFKEDMRTSNPNDLRNPLCDQGSRPLAIAKFKIISTNQILIAISVHFKAGGNKKSIRKRYKQLDILSQILKFYRSQGIENFVVMGDFNSTEYSKKGEHYNKFNTIVGDMKLTNTTKKLGCTSYWWGGIDDNRLYPSTLDHILVSTSFLQSKQVTNKFLGHCQQLHCAVTDESQMGSAYDEVSDHCPLTTSVK